MYCPAGFFTLNAVWPLAKVLFEGVKSAEPPTSAGILPAMASSTLPEAMRVAIFPAGNSGMSSAPAGISLFRQERNAADNSGRAASYLASKSCHRRSAFAPPAPVLRVIFSTSSAMKNDLSAGRPSFFLVNTASSLPSGAPCASSEPALFGLPKPMTVRQAMMLGLSDACASVMAARMAS